MKRYILIDDDGDIVSDNLGEEEVYHTSFRAALSDANSIASRRDKKDKIYIFQGCGIVEGKQ